jgi:hypothetical protein
MRDSTSGIARLRDFKRNLREHETNISQGTLELPDEVNVRAIAARWLWRPWTAYGKIGCKRAEVCDGAGDTPGFLGLYP